MVGKRQSRAKELLNLLRQPRRRFAVSSELIETNHSRGYTGHFPFGLPTKALDC